MSSSLPPEGFVEFSRRLGDPSADLAILGEGNTSIRGEEPGTFWVKASGCQLGTISSSGFVLMRSKPLMEALAGPSLSDAEVKSVLASSRVDPSGDLMPSVESFMHAALLELEGVNVVGHVHPTPLLSLLCLEGAEEIAGQRLFPDEIVCCGPATCWVPYTDPGLALSLAIMSATEDFVASWGQTPKVWWLGNHGLIGVGANTKEVESAVFMGAKSARVWLGAVQAGRPIQVLSSEQVERIAGRPDEHYRQRMLWTSGN
jgi:rhamnose utilization protein RhaD (predicted bifunctional aldolase and dehydrogenase)